MNDEGRISEEELFSWVDRDAPELQTYLEAHPEEALRVARLRAEMRELERDLRLLEPEIPSRIGAFEIRGILGAGGMGVVYEAVQPDPRRSVALKVIRPLDPSPELLQRRFRREVQSLARLSHPGIAQVYEAGHTEEGQRYLCMELVRGAPLTRYAREARLDREERLDLFREVASAVEHAHEHGVVHRDLKPANILVTAEGKPKVLDFGLARLADDELSQSAALSRTGSLVGTLEYMSPEQARGKQAEVGVASDVYSLGVLLYELVGERLPIEIPKNDLAKAVQTIAEKPPRRLGRSVPPDLRAVIAKALEKRPGDRYPNVRTFLAEVERARRGEPVYAREAGLLRRALRFAGRHPVATVLLPGLAMALLWIGLLQLTAVNYHADFTGDGFPEVVPWSGMRWEGSQAEVLLDGTWYGLESIEGLQTATIVAYAKQVTTDSNRPFHWKKRIEEDIWQVLFRMGEIPWARVDLGLRDLETGEPLERKGVWLNDSRRRETFEYKRTREHLPFQDLRWRGVVPEVLVDERWYELSAIDGVQAGAMVRLLQDEVTYWRQTFVEELANLVAELGREPGDTVELELLDLESGRTLVQEDVPRTEADRESYLERSRRTPFTGLRATEEGVEVRLDEVWYRLLALDGIPIEDLEAAARTFREERWAEALRLDLVKVLRQLGHELGEDTRLDLEDLNTGTPLHLPEAPNAPENWRHLLLQDHPLSVRKDPGVRVFRIP